MSTSVADAVAQLGVTRVVHFTPARNLDGILRDGMLRDTTQLGADGQPHHTATDDARVDSRPELICCSLEYPNAYYQAQAKQRPQFVNFPGWVCLLLSPEVLHRQGTLFHPCNAAKRWGAYGKEGPSALLEMWASPSVPGGLRRKAGHLPNVPTDLQAEVQIPGPIPLSEVRAIVTPTPARAKELFGHYRAMGQSPERIQWRSAPLFFDKFGLRDAIHYGQAIPETIWTPTSEDLQ